MNFIKKVNEMERNSLVTGQLFFRYQAPAIELDMTHRQIFSVSGIIALPDECSIKPEHQYTLAGFESMSQGVVIIGVDPSTGINLKSQAKGRTIGQLLLDPIWKI